MQKKTLPTPSSDRYLEFLNNVDSYEPVNRNGWWIKFSLYNTSNILLTFTSMFTGQTVIRYFDDENDAVKYINYIIELDPTILIPD